MFRLPTTDPQTAAQWTTPFFIADRNYYLIAVYERHETKGTVGTLAYNTQTGNFTVGQVVTGGTSGATGTITADADSGTSGTLTLSGIAGNFAVGETITDPVTGSAKVASALAGVTVMLKKVPNGTAPSAGTDMLSTGMTLNSIINTNQTATLSTTAGAIAITRGDSLAFITTGTLTALVGVTIAVVLRSA